MLWLCSPSNVCNKLIVKSNSNDKPKIILIQAGFTYTASRILILRIKAEQQGIFI